MDKIFVKMPQNLIFRSFFDRWGVGGLLVPADLTGFFFKNWALLHFLFYDYLTSCKIR